MGTVDLQPVPDWRDSRQAQVVRKAIAEKGMVYLTTRQIMAVLDGLWAAGYLREFAEPRDGS